MLSINLKLRFFASFAGLAVVLVASIGWWLVDSASEQLRRQVGLTTQRIAEQMADKLERGLYERYRDVQVAASLIGRTELYQQDDVLRETIQRLQQTYSDYAWIGYADIEGRVVAATGGLLEGNRVDRQAWFQQGLQKPYISDVHDAQLLKQLLAPTSGQSLRFVDISAPVRDADSQRVVGVVAAHLNWRWVDELAESLTTGQWLLQPQDLVLVSAKNQVIGGPPLLIGKSLNTPSTDLASVTRSGYVIESWPDGRDYVVGYARHGSYRDYPGLPWVVLARQPVNEALAGVQQFRRDALIIGLLITFFITVLAWLNAGRISRPLLRLTAAARALQQQDSKDIEIPLQDDYPEVRDLSATLQHMVMRLQTKSEQLTQLNRELDHKVRLRTEELQQLNKALQNEIAERKLVQQERETLIEQLELQANTDPLTKLSNRRRFFQRAERVIKRAERNPVAVNLLTIDIDHFKAVNDTYGHAAGDAILAVFAQLLRELTRDIDIVARTGGEEFVLLLEHTDQAGAKILAERIHQRLSEQLFNEQGMTDVQVTVSIGIAQWQVGESLDHLLARSDKALYDAKQQGRDQTKTAT
ncbi:sensor domain-containing diguanylate cyclase [Idiomarina xiamenensis]|uniref:diguanylate cyclase n=1 Tax=Idiomarina xiamenensis 10-D-4 TaxID=740709 RepID=K2KTF0_9GAMM|nr:sensor domain-containing diguanylate cyclase [Idiomarina xiamenensis]EKE80915.1 diguanylate cyclase [Idiomarina xiamenensis 10-D-4]